MSPPLTVLLVEDEALVAMDLEELLIEEGYSICGVADNRADALKLASTSAPDIALVDLHLTDGLTGPEIGVEMATSGCLVVFMTANVSRVPSPVNGILGVIPKPYTDNGMRSALRFVAACCSGDEVADAPPSIVLLNCKT